MTRAERKKKRVVSGMRPTGPLHIGHYFGALQNWVHLQSDTDYECFYFIADWHALTSDYADPSSVTRNTLEMAIDWLALGLNPKRCTMFVQSAVPEHAELNLLLSMVTSLGSLERVPTYKEQLENIKDRDLHTYGFLGYPVLQAADIVAYSRGASSLVVPVGEDQVSHLELTREIVRKFNFHYGLRVSKRFFAPNPKNVAAFGRLLDTSYGMTVMPIEDSEFLKLRVTLKKRIAQRIVEIGFDNFLRKYDLPASYFALRDVLLEPDVLLTRSPRVPGIDGRKMSKSYGNFIALNESDEEIRDKARKMVTDPARVRRSDPGNPDVCPVFSWHKLVSDDMVIDRVNEECRSAKIGCVQCKGLMADSLVRWIAPVRERRMHYQKNIQSVRDVLENGSVTARRQARNTMMRVREAVFGDDRLRRRRLRKRQKLVRKAVSGHR